MFYRIYFTQNASVWSLQRRHNERGEVSNHLHLDCLPTLSSSADQRKYQSSTSLAFARGIHRPPVDCPHKRPVTQKIFSFDDDFMVIRHNIQCKSACQCLVALIKCWWRSLMLPLGRHKTGNRSVRTIIFGTDVTHRAHTVSFKSLATRWLWFWKCDFQTHVTD